MQFEILENRRVRLLPITTLQDAEPLRTLALAQPELAKYSPSDWRDDASFNDYFLTALASRVPFSVFDKSSHMFAGSTSFGNIDATNQRIEIGWTWLGHSFQRTGLNRQMKFLMLEFAFARLRMQRVELKADARNQQSRLAMEGIGAKYEGCLRSHTVMQDGFRRDTVYYSILANEWSQVAKRLLQTKD